MNEAPPPLPDKVGSILKLQLEDGSWQSSGPLCKLLAKTGLQIKAAAQVVIRKLRDQDLVLPYPEVSDVVTLFITMLSVEVITRTNPTTSTSPAWRVRAQEFIKERAQEHEPFIQSQVEILLDGVRQNVQFCKTCQTTRPAVLKVCPNCFRQENEQYLKPASRADAYAGDFADKKSVVDLQAIEWETMKGCQWVAGGLGSFGVLLIDLPSGVVVVKCAGSNWMSEYLGNAVVRGASIPCPALRPLDRESTEGQCFWEQVTHAPFTNPEDAQRLSKYSQYSVFYVIEYVPSAQSLILSGEQSHSLLTPHQLLPQLARVMSVDVLMNNYDRIPLIWNNEGNPSNLLVQGLTSSSPRIVCIDQMVTPISDAYYLPYEQSVQRMIGAFQLTCEHQTVTPETRELFSRLLSFFSLHFQVDLTDDQLVCLGQYVLQELRSLSTWVLSGALRDIPDYAHVLPPTLDTCPQAVQFMERVAQSCVDVL